MLPVLLLALAWPWPASADDLPPPGGGPIIMPYQASGLGPAGRDAYGVITGAPTRPGEAIRPASWVGGLPPQAPGGLPPQSAGPPPAWGASPCEEAQILARVATDVVLSHDLFAAVDELISRSKAKLSAHEIEKQRAALAEQVTAGLRQLLAHMNDPDPGNYVDPQQRALLVQLLQQQVEIKLIYQDFRRTVPAENLPHVEEQLGRDFEQTGLPELLKREGVQTRQDLEWKLRAKQSSIEREKRIYCEKMIANQWIFHELNMDKEVTHDQMLEWYQAHVTEFDKPARARWEELMVSFSRYKSPAEAYAALAQMGNQVLAGAPLAEVAKARSDGLTATSGGRHDWTARGSLASDRLDEALFTLPLGQLSPIIEGATGDHIIRVTERQPATRTPFAESQKEVREKIRKERINKQQREYLAKLHRQFPVWTIFDETTRRTKPPGEEPSRY
jgi:parvulin-like peptidyl-prolyl isomerase